MILDQTQLPDILDRLEHVRKFSPANKRKVGAIIYNKNGKKITILSEGYNHMFNKSDSCEDIDGITNPEVIHAEEDAIMKLMNKFRTNGRFFMDSQLLFMVCTYAPCVQCAKLIIQSGIKELYYLTKHPVKFSNCTHSPEQLLLSAGVNVHNIVEVFPGCFTEQKQISEDNSNINDFI